MDYNKCGFVCALNVFKASEITPSVETNNLLIHFFRLVEFGGSFVGEARLRTTIEGSVSPGRLKFGQDSQAKDNHRRFSLTG